MPLDPSDGAAVNAVLKKAFPKVRVRPVSHQIRNPDGTAGKWVPVASIWDDVSSEVTTVTQAYSVKNVLFDTQADADNYAVYLGALAIRENH